MATTYRKLYNTKETPQTEPIPGKNMVKNNAGGYAFQLDDWKRLDRFLILGSDGATYYISAKKLTVDNAKVIEKLIKEDGVRVVNRIVEISDSGRAPKNDSALFALAMCSAFGDEKIKKASYDALPKVARISTHLFHYVDYVDGLRGWGRGLRHALENWYAEKTVDNLAYDMVKYQQRDGWGHADVIKLAHPKAIEAARNQLFAWAVKGEVGEQIPQIVNRYEEIKNETDAKKVAKMVLDYKLPREIIPTNLLWTPEVAEVLLRVSPITALIRNLGNFSKAGVLKAGAWENNKFVVNMITNQNVLAKGRVHPVAILSALMTYKQGHGVRGNNEWTPVKDVCDALEQAFYLSFKNVTPANKRIVIGLDVSGSMSSGEITGVPGLCPAVAAAAMSMVSYKTEPMVELMAFNNRFTKIDISRANTLDEVIRKTAINNMGGTDCALPMIWAKENNIDVDSFYVYTDGETWAGRIAPVQALQQYKQKTGIDSKLIVVGMTSTGFTIAEPGRTDMMDVVGFDTAAPEIMSSFSRGEL